MCRVHTENKNAINPLKYGLKIIKEIIISKKYTKTNPQNLMFWGFSLFSIVFKLSVTSKN